MAGIGIGLGLLNSRKAASGGGAALVMSTMATDALVSGFPSAALVSGTSTFIHTGSGNATGGNIELHKLTAGIVRTSSIMPQWGAEDHAVAGAIITAGGRGFFAQLLHNDPQGFNYSTTINALPSTDQMTRPRDVPFSYAGATTASYGLTAGPFSNDAVLVFNRLNGVPSRSAWRFARTTSAALDTEATGGANATWTETVPWDSPDTKRDYPVMFRGRAVADRIHFAHYFGDGNATPLRYHYMQLVAGVWQHFTGNGTQIGAAQPWDVETQLTSGNGSIANAGAVAYKVQDISEGPDGFPRILYFVAPTGELPGKTDLRLEMVRMTAVGVWSAPVVILNNQKSLAAAGSIWPGATFDGRTHNIVYASVDGATNKEIRQYTINEGAGTAAQTLQCSPLNGTIDRYRPKSPRDWNADCQAYWFKLNSFSNFDNFNSDMEILGNAAIPDEVAGVSSYLSQTTTYCNRYTAAPSTTVKNTVELYLRELNTAGILAKLDVLHLLNMHDAQCKLFDVLNAARDFTEVGAGTWTAFKGYTGPTGSDYLQGPNFSAMTFYGLNANSVYGFQKGSAGVISGTSVNDILLQVNAGGGAQARNNTPIGISSTSVKSNSPSYGVCMVRPDASNVFYYRDGQTNANGAASSSAIPTDARAFFRGAGGVGIVVAAGGALTFAEQNTLNMATYRFARRMGSL